MTINLNTDQIYTLPYVEEIPDENEIDRAEQEWDVRAQDQLELKNMIRDSVRLIRQKIAELRLSGASSREVRAHIRQRLQELETDFVRIQSNVNLYESERSRTQHGYQTVAARIDASRPNFTPFSKRKKGGEEVYKQRPSYSKAINAYSEVEGLFQLQEVVGGKLKQNFDGKIFINGCASRISYVLNQTGYKIPVMPGKTVSGSNGDQYIYRLSDLEKFLRKAFGPPDCEWRKGSVIGKSSIEKCKYVSGVEGKQGKGILIERWEPGPHTTCTGHAKLIDGTKWTIVYPPENGQFWELPNCIEDKESVMEKQQAIVLWSDGVY